MSAAPPPLLEAPDPHERWRFLRDVIVVQLKLFVGNIQNFLLIPVSIVAAIIDVIFKGKRHGHRFYTVLEWGRRTDEAINVYGCIGGYYASGADGETSGIPHEFTLDAMIKQVEGVIVREYQKGGTAASVKDALDRALDEMQTKTGSGKDKAVDAVKAAADKLRDAAGPK
jgi:hypothetical protein